MSSTLQHGTMTSPGNQHIDRCAQCPAPSLAPTLNQCLAHASADDISTILSGAAGRADLRVANIACSNSDVVRLLGALRSERNLKHLANATFNNVEFSDDVLFVASFGPGTKFIECTFKGDVRFGGARFDEDCTFYKCTFLGTTDFGDISTTGRFTVSECTFQKATTFASARFGGPALFNNIRIANLLSFNSSKFSDRFDLDDLRTMDCGGKPTLTMRNSVFEADLSLRGSQMLQEPKDSAVPIMDLSGSTFSGTVNMRGVHLVGDVLLNEIEIRAAFDLRGSTIDGSVLLIRSTILGHILLQGSRISNGNVDMTSATFDEAIDLEVANGQKVDLTNAQIRRGGSIRIGAKSTNLEGTTFSGPTRLTGTGTGPLPVLSLAGADVGGLHLSNVDLRKCALKSSINLDQLRTHSSVLFNQTDGGPRGSRSALSEELWLRARQASWWPMRLSRADSRTEALEVAELYRAMRVGQEARGDAAGASDFYFGEMKMRSMSASGVEKAILRTYHFLSGYGLRPLRASMILFATVTFTGILIGRYGLDQASGSTDGVLYAISNSVALFDGLDRKLNTIGESLMTALSIFVPIQIALTAIALRNQVKR